MEHIAQSPVPHNAKAVIALTSWKKRISTVGLTIFNLLTMCGPEFHIVLTLAEEEFPKKERELPRDLVLMNKAGMFEILWVKKNYKAFKKILFTMQRYQKVPIISADDDCIYRFNYAEELYNVWKVNKTKRVCYWCGYLSNKIYNTSGYATIHPPYFYKDAYRLINDNVINLCEDDLFYAAICKIKNTTGCICLNSDFNEVAIVHDEETPLHNGYRGNTKSGVERFSTMCKIVEESANEHHWK